METIFSYVNYRDFLRDAYAHAKRALPAFSYRYFAKKAGFTAPNFLKLVIEGTRNLSGESIPKFAKVFKLGARERRFFEILVYFNQAGTPAEQAHYYEQLLEFPEYCRAQKLASEQYDYLSHWYYPVVQELVSLPDFEEAPDWIAKKLQGQITPGEAREALKCLRRLKLVGRDADGVLRPAQQHITTGDAAYAAAAYNFHDQMIDRAKTALHSQPPAQREFAALTIGLNARQLPLLKTAIRNFRKVVLNIATPEAHESFTGVYQLNLQLFAHVALSPDEPEKKS